MYEIKPASRLEIAEEGRLINLHNRMGFVGVFMGGLVNLLDKMLFWTKTVLISSELKLHFPYFKFAELFIKITPPILKIDCET